MDYKNSGVDIEAGYKSVELIRDMYLVIGMFIVRSFRKGIMIVRIQVVVH